MLAADGTSVLDAIDVADTVRGRQHAAGGMWLYPDVPTPGGPNHFSLNDAIIINEIMYHGLGIPGSQGMPATYGTTTVVGFESTWRYGKAFTFGDADQPYDAGQDWDDVAHAVDGSNWTQRPAPFGFIRGRSPLTIETRLASPAVNSNYITTYYFENDFTLAQSAIDGMDGLLLRYLVDDGAVFYLNGQEISRFNMPAGTTDVNTLASSDISSNRLAVSDFVEIPKGLLVAEPGVNRLSVEVHQSSLTSEDVAFAAELAARELINPGFPSISYSELAEEWIELYNRSAASVDLTGWTIGGDVQYEFPPGTTLMPDSYLVVANDLAQLRAKYPTRANIIGNLDGNLPNSNGRIVLVDAAHNPADEVHYFDGGHWDERADGFGPSLELQDPRADNAKGEAWSASDEASKSQWRTYTYRGVAQTTISGEPTLWHEFALGMLDGAGRGPGG